MATRTGSRSRNGEAPSTSDVVETSGLAGMYGLLVGEGGPARNGDAARETETDGTPPPSPTAEPPTTADTRPATAVVRRADPAPSSWGLGDGQAVPWDYAPSPD